MLGFHTVRGGIDPGDHRFVYRFVGIVDVRENRDPGVGSCPPRVTRTLQISGWSFHTVRSAISPEDHCIRLQYVGIQLLCMYARNHNPGMEPYLAQVALAPPTPVGVSTPCGAASTQGTTVFVPGLLDLSKYIRKSDPRMAIYPPRLALALRTPGWGFLVVLGAIDPGAYRFVSSWRCRCSAGLAISSYGILSSVGGAGSTHPRMRCSGRAGMYRATKPMFSSPPGACWSCSILTFC